MLKMFFAGLFGFLETAPLTEEQQAVLNVQKAVYTAIISASLSFAMVFLATCDDRLMASRDGGFLRCCISCFAKCAMCYAWCMMLSLGSVGLSLVFIVEGGSIDNYLSVTGQSIAMSWVVVWPLLNGGLLFWFKRWRELRALAKKGEKTQDGISFTTLEWWKKNEFPSDSSLPSPGTGQGKEMSMQQPYFNGPTVLQVNNPLGYARQGGQHELAVIQHAHMHGQQLPPSPQHQQCLVQMSVQQGMPAVGPITPRALGPGQQAARKKLMV
jgi:hypothetical protein